LLRISCKSDCRKDSEAASNALQVTVRKTFNDLKMKTLPRNWLEIIAVKA
jgi:hypothetical protein